MPPIGVGAGVDSIGGGVVGLSGGGDVFGGGSGAEPFYDSERVRAQHPHRLLAAVAAGVGGVGGGKAALDGLGGGEEAPELRRRKYPGGRQGESTRGREREKEEKVVGV